MCAKTPDPYQKTQNGEIDHSIYCYGQHRLTATLDETPKYKHSVFEELYFNW